MEQIKRPDQPGIGLQELPAKTLCTVPSAHDIEAPAHGPIGARLQAHEVERQEGRHRGAFIDLHRMASDPVTQVNAPGQAGRCAVGPVGQTGKQAAKTANDDAERKGADEHPAG